MSADIERWRMPSGRVAVIDLSQAPEAIEDARRLLREFGDAEPINEDAPGTGGNQPEGENQNTNPQEGEPAMPESTSQCIMTDTPTPDELRAIIAADTVAALDAAGVKLTVGQLADAAEMLGLMPSDLFPGRRHAVRKGRASQSRATGEPVTAFCGTTLVARPREVAENLPWCDTCALMVRALPGRR